MVGRGSSALASLCPQISVRFLFAANCSKFSRWRTECRLVGQRRWAWAFKIVVLAALMFAINS
jgi:hypothetical protein